MQLLALKVARQFLWDLCSGLAYDETNASEVANVNNKINLASLAFFSEASFRGTLQRAVVTAYDNQITSPRELQTVLAAKTDSGCRSARVNPIWYEFLSGSFACDTRGLNDLGEGFCTFRDIPDDLPIVVRSNEDSGTGAIITFVVTNVDGTAQFDVPLNVPATQVNTPLTGKIIRISKPVTAGRIEIYYLQNGVETLCGMLKPSETDANYRRYRVATGITSVDAMWKRCWLPALSDIEPVVPNNLLALGEMILALQYRSQNDRERYKDAKAEAISIADKDRQQFDGDNQTPIFQVTRGFGAADIPRIGNFGYWGDYVPGDYPS